MEPQQQQQQCRDRRPEALGDLSVLPDELLCAVLGLLGPTDLARLACVSSVMYILCNEEPLWMNLCLGDGGLLEYKGSWKKTTLVRKNLQPEIQEYSRKSLQFDGFNSLFLYRRWYRCYTSLDAFSLDNGDVERKTDLTSEEFILKYDGERPVLLTELSKSWPAKSKWTTDQLLRNYGEVAFRISQRSSKKILMKLKDYVSYIQLQHDEDPLYIFDDKFGEAAPGLLEDFSVPHLFHEDFFDVLDRDQRPPFRWLIIGPERSGASWHVDPALTSAWNTLLSGRKRWALYPPGRVPVGVTVHVNEEDGDVNIESPSSLEWWLDIYPFLAEQDKPLECTQLPGETIFVPSGWWHCVLNLETTIAVTQNFVNKTNFEFVCLDMAPGHRHKGVCRAGLLAIQEEGSYECKKDQSSGVNQLNYPDMTRKEKRLRFNDLREKCVYGSNLNEVRRRSESFKNLHNEEFSYCINFLTTFLEEDRDHYNSIWSPSNCIGQREMRGWLHKLWVTKPELRQLIWKGACIALNAEKWLACITEICARYNLPSPSDDEKLPVGTGSNPVFLISDYVIKIYVEDGLESSIHGLGTELEFYSLLRKVDSSLINHVPRVLSSGIIANENGAYKTFPWDGKGVPDIISSNGFSTRATTDDGFSFGVWSKTQFKLNNPGLNFHTHIWPYLITERCKGDIFVHIRDLLSMDDVLHLASFLGDQLRTLHLLPVPHLLECVHLETDKMSLTERIDNCLIKDSDEAAANAYVEIVNEGFKIPPEWKLIVSVLDRRKKQLVNRLVQWGDPIPKFLIEKVEEYIPQDLSLLFDIYKSLDGSYKAGRSPAWIHSDIMDDNIYMQPCTTYSLSDESAPEETSTMNGTQHLCNGKVSARKWQPTHILDFSDVCIGDPLYDLIPIYLDVFRGNTSLLKQLLKSYRLSLAGLTTHSNALSCGPLDDQKFQRISYRAMCFCILHEENILGAIFSLWKELKMAQSWQEVEEVVWGELNHYLPSD